MTVLVFASLALLSAAVWIYLVFAHGRYWLMDQHLPEVGAPDSGSPSEGWPRVVAIVPARDEADVLPLTLTTLLTQDYPGDFRIVLVDDASTDGTSRVAEKLAAEHPGRTLEIVHSDGPPPGWAGKVAAMNRGFTTLATATTTATVAAASSTATADAATAAAAAIAPEYVLFTDADIAHPADSVRRLVSFGEARGLDLVSLMARLRTETTAERAIVPAFVYSFAQLYPFRRVNRPGSHVGAAAGGCMLVRYDALVHAGGLARIAGARIDDVALGQLLKSAAPAEGGPRRDDTAGRTWLGLTVAVRSVRPYPRLADLWDMIARSAYTQLRRSPLLLIGTLLGLLVMYAVPPVFGLAFLPAALSSATSGGNAVTAASALSAWTLMSISYLPTLRLYGLRAWRAPVLPAVMMLYGAMTFDSALRHYRGRGGRWKGRVEQG
ncbi:MAG: glycosyltransferase [Actinocrinis sp.]